MDFKKGDIVEIMEWNDALYHVDRNKARLEHWPTDERTIYGIQKSDWYSLSDTPKRILEIYEDENTVIVKDSTAGFKWLVPMECIKTSIEFLKDEDFEL